EQDHRLGWATVVGQRTKLRIGVLLIGRPVEPTPGATVDVEAERGQHRGSEAVGDDHAAEIGGAAEFDEHARRVPPHDPPEARSPSRTNLGHHATDLRSIASMGATARRPALLWTVGSRCGASSARSTYETPVPIPTKLG